MKNSTDEYASTLINRILELHPFDRKKAEEIASIYIKQASGDLLKSGIAELELRRQGLIKLLSKENIGYKIKQIQEKLSEVNAKIKAHRKANQTLKNNQSYEKSLNDGLSPLSDEQKLQTIRRDYDELKKWVRKQSGEKSLLEFYEMMKLKHWNAEKKVRVPLNS